MRRWGAAYLLVGLFLGSWAGQLVAQLPTIYGDPATGATGWAEFWSATFENWQSEFLQLAVQATLVVAAARYVFAVSLDDHDRLEAKVDELLTRIEPPPNHLG